MRETRWYSPNGRHGFRIDQAFVNPALLAHLREAAYVWGRPTRLGQRDAASDHAALLVDLGEGRSERLGRRSDRSRPH